MRFSILCTPLQLTALIKPNWCILLYSCACLHWNTILMETGWTTIPCPATNLSILICKSSARTKKSVISVALKTPLEIRLGICIYKTSLLHRPDGHIGFPPSCPPHILQQNCALQLSKSNKHGENVLTFWPCCCRLKYTWIENENLWSVGFNEN